MPTKAFSHKRAEQETVPDFRLKPWTPNHRRSNGVACGGLKPFFIILGEGAAMEFIAPADALALDLVATARELLPEFLAGPLYQRLTRG